MRQKFTSILILFLLLPLFSEVVQVQTTLFPLFDFARTIGGDKATVSLLLPPGAEPHSYEPTPHDVISIKEADLFIYTGPFMEPWVGTLAQGKATIVNASDHLPLHNKEECEEEHHDHRGEHHHNVDPHIWTNPVFCLTIVDNILAGFITIDAQNREYYTSRADSLKKELKALDTAIR